MFIVQALGMWVGIECSVVVPEKQDAEATALKWTADKTPDGKRYEPCDIFISGPHKFGENTVNSELCICFEDIIASK